MTCSQSGYPPKPVYTDYHTHTHIYIDVCINLFDSEAAAPATVPATATSTHREAGSERLRQRAGLPVGAGPGNTNEPRVCVGNAEAGGGGPRCRRASAEESPENLVGWRTCCFHVVCVSVNVLRNKTDTAQPTILNNT